MNFPRSQGLCAFLLLIAGTAARAQFKEIKAAPFSPAVARQKISALLEKADAGNRDQTVATLSSWLDWYRDILDEEMIARWKSDARANLPLVMAPLADTRVAAQVIDFSWREQREATFQLAYAAMLGDLMARYPDSARPFLNDLLGPAPPELPQPVAETVCRILLDMPDIGMWKKNALLILPHYRSAADRLLKQDVNGPDQEAMYRALRWRSDLKLDPPAVTSQKQNTRQGQAAPRSLIGSRASLADRTPGGAMPDRPHIVSPQAAPAYNGPMSGTFESTGGAIPENGEYVFPDVPPVKLLLDFDTKHWEARLQQIPGQGQVLVLRNKGRGPQKRCVVHWTVVP